jgi:membrane-associated phospholipid phosphatase
LASAVRRGTIDVWTAVTGTTVLLICGAIAANGRVGALERMVFRAVNGLSDRLEPPMRAAQYLGVLAVGPIAVVVALVLRRWRLALAAALVTVGKLLAERAVWQVVTRERPGVTEPVVHVRGGSAASGVSFVSGHVVLLTGLAWIVTPYLRGRWRVAPWAAVALVAFARVYLGAHNPLDVIGGFALGAAIGAAANLIVGVPETKGGRSVAAPAASLE